MKRLLLTFCLTLILSGPILPFLYAQQPGQILTGAIPSLNEMDPNGDGWVTASGSSFLAIDEDQQFEKNWLGDYGLSNEATGDAKFSTSCGTVDIVCDKSKSAYPYYVYYESVDGQQNNGNDMLMFRVRTADSWKGSDAAFHVLLDTDGKFGFNGPKKDTNAVNGNPGFEIELIAKLGTASGIYAYDVDGSVSGTALASYATMFNYQQSVAYFNQGSCTGLATFQDFMVNVADIGLVTSTEVRMAVASSTNGISALISPPADIAGVNDNSVMNLDNTWKSVVHKQTPTAVSDLVNNPQTFPVELISFSANAGGKGVMLNWATASETNNDFFTLEKSYDGETYSTLAQVEGMQSDRNYRFIDGEAGTGTIYYRLSQTDLNGSTMKLATEEVVLGGLGADDFNVYPNPSTGLFNLDFTLDTGNGQTVTVENLAGQIVWKGAYAISSAEPMEIDLRTMPSGMYLLRVASSTNSKTRKIRKY